MKECQTDQGKKNTETPTLPESHEGHYLFFCKEEKSRIKTGIYFYCEMRQTKQNCVTVVVKNAMFAVFARCEHVMP